ncbi:MAG: hypothetical protein Q7R54_03620 [bacterium]|nr:hypothetical protein [bacterium]
MQETNEFSFVLKPSMHGVGVFVAHDIAKGTELRLFGDTDPVRTLRKEDVPEYLQHFCVNRADMMICPPDFGFMPIGWYLNHSSSPNAAHNGSMEAGY